MMQIASKYAEETVRPMREELTSIGIEELFTAEAVDAVIKGSEGTSLVIINSVCGCAAGSARPALKIALQNDTLPDKVTTVFAGVDQEAVTQARSYISGYPPSSPSMALFKNGQLIFMLARHQIEGRGPAEIAGELIDTFNEHCK